LKSEIITPFIVSILRGFILEVFYNLSISSLEAAFIRASNIQALWAGTFILQEFYVSFLTSGEK
jgi:hypothetical protein